MQGRFEGTCISKSLRLVFELQGRNQKSWHENTITRLLQLAVRLSQIEALLPWLDWEILGDFRSDFTMLDPVHSHAGAQ